MFWSMFSELCTLSGTTPSAVATAVGLSNSITTKWKNGAYPKGDILLKLAEHLNVSVDYLLTGKEKSTKSDLTEIEIEVLEIFNKLTVKDQLKFIGRMEQQYEEYATSPMILAARTADPENTNCRPQIDPAKLEALDDIPTMDEE